MIMATAFTIEPWASTTAATSPNSMSEKYSGERNCSANFARIGANAAIKMVPTVPAKNEPTAAIASAAPARPRLRHAIAVDAGHDRRQFAGQVDQDRRGRAAVLRAVVDAGEHDQRTERTEAEGDRQQHRDGRDRPDPGQHADQRSDQAPEQAEQEIDRCRGGAKADRQVVQDVHLASRFRSSHGFEVPPYELGV